jgi:hypothetical protein
MAYELLAELPRSVGPYVFTSNGGRLPYQGYHRAKQKLDADCGVNAWVVHDIRRTMRSRLSALPIEEVVREHMVAHGPTGIKGVYNRYQYDNEKPRGYELYEAALRMIISPPDPVVVIPMRRAVPSP